MAYRQADRICSVFSNLGEDVLLVRRLVAREQIGRPFRVSLELASERDDLDFAALLGTSMTVRIKLEDDGAARYVNGLVASFGQVGMGRRLTNYEAELVPWLSVLEHSAGCRIFQNLSTLEIVKSIFSERRFSDVDDRTSATYPRRDYTVQYRETDYDFVMRLMEESGIGYYFVHDEKRHMLVLFDSPSGNVANAQQVATYAAPAEVFRPGNVWTWSHRRSLGSGVYSLGDYDFERPSASLHVTAMTASPIGGNDVLEVYDYPGEYTDVADGEALVRMRMEAEECAAIVAQGTSDCARFSPGTHFTLSAHYRPDQNASHLITQVDHSAAQSLDEEEHVPSTYSNTFSCIPYAIRWRARRTTPRPRVAGVQTAVVVGPAGEEIYVDAHGRIKVQFHWDRSGERNEHSSCWIRVAQAWAGKAWGGMAIPRIGQEVLVDFVDGDPDRPVVVGRVYNGEQKVPFALPAHKTQSGLRTRSTPGSGAQTANELRFEDKAGEEQILLHAQRQLDVRVGESRFETIGQDAHSIVQRDLFSRVENERHTKVAGDEVVELGSDCHIKITGKQAIEIGGARLTTVSGNVADQLKGNHAAQVTGSYYLKAAGVVIEAMQGITLKCGSSSVVIDAAGVTVSGGIVTVDGTLVKIASGPGSIAASGSPGSIVAPMAPKAAQAADEPGESQSARLKAQREASRSRAYAVAPVSLTPFTRADQLAAVAQARAAGKQTAWIEIELLDESGAGVAGEPYEIILPDGGRIARGTLDENGRARVEGIDPGACKVTFPRLDTEAWEPA